MTDRHCSSLSVIARRSLMFWEKKLEYWAAGVRDKLSLPLRVELWNGQHLNLSHLHPEVIIRVPHVSALSCLFTPSLSNLGAAYVDGKIDVEGKPSAIISIGNALASGTLKLEGKFARIIRKIQHSKEKDKAAIQYHYDVSDAFYQLWLDDKMVYSCAYFEHGDEDLSTAQTKKNRSDSAKNPFTLWRYLARYWLWLGCVSDSGCTMLWRSLRRRDALRKSGSLCTCKSGGIRSESFD